MINLPCLHNIKKSIVVEEANYHSNNRQTRQTESTRGSVLTSSTRTSSTRFMQSESRDISNTPLTENTTNTTSPLQHGLSTNISTTPDGRLNERSLSESAAEDAADNGSVTSSANGRGRRLDLRRMSSGQYSQESSPGSRIDAYERANAVYRRPSDETIFQLIPSTNSNGTSVMDMPNEVLTHILSHLPPESLSSMSLINRRFHRLVTTPHAWRIAFARYFPGSQSTKFQSGYTVEEDTQKSQRRAFTRVSALASWRSEYILRTRLLRSLGRGRPALQAMAEKGQKSKSTPAAVVTYSSGLMYPASNIHAYFGSGLNKKQPLFIHGAVEQGTVTSSDPATGKASGWGLADFEAFKHFADLYTGEAPYGMGAGDLVGMTNVMDVSHSFGKLYGEACPGGRLFYTSTAEQRGRFLMVSSPADYAQGIPNVSPIDQALTAVWLAKNEHVLKVTNGLFGALAGSSIGVLSAFAIGSSPVYDRRFDRGELTARWAICPGVPIVAISVDEKVSARRIGRGRIWATILNAFGEVFYLTDVPVRRDVRGKLSERELDHLAWETGRSTEWIMIESTRRTARPDPYQVSSIDGSYTPRSSSAKHELSTLQLEAEAREITQYLNHKPKYFQGICDGWDMCRSLVVDYAGDDHCGGGEGIVVITHGLEGHLDAAAKRLIRFKSKLTIDHDEEAYPAISRSAIVNPGNERTSSMSSPGYSAPRSRTSSNEDLGESIFQTSWRISNFSFGDMRKIEVTTTALDESDFAVLSANEDPLLGMSGGSDTSSPLASPLGKASYLNSASEIPGQRARLFGVGTADGNIILWDIRGSPPSAVDIVNTIEPSRMIFTKSPGISSLAMTSLYVVHGGSDGLVQAWDPLASTLEPVRTLNSRFSDRARRRMAQAEVSVHGVGINYYAAGAIALDPDPTMLRGMVSLGTHLRYWSFSAGAADAYKSRKRGGLRRRSDRGSNSAGIEAKYHHTGRGVLRDYIDDERLELEREKTNKRKEAEKMMARFGTNLLGEDAGEEEILAYATMLSEESYASDEIKRQPSPPYREASAAGSKGPVPTEVEAFDDEMEEAIRLSLLETSAAAEAPQSLDFAVPIRYGKKSKQSTPVKRGPSPPTSSQQRTTSEEDLEFALALSKAEEESKKFVNEQDFPVLAKSSSGSSVEGKGKSRRR